MSDRLSRRISGRYTNRKTITQNLPEDSILNEVFNFEEWERDWEVAQRRQTVAMGALPENELTEKDMDWVLLSILKPASASTDLTVMAK